MIMHANVKPLVHCEMHLGENFLTSDLTAFCHSISDFDAGRGTSQDNESRQGEVEEDLQEFDQELPIRHAVSFETRIDVFSNFVSLNFTHPVVNSILVKVWKSYRDECCWRRMQLQRFL